MTDYSKRVKQALGQYQVAYELFCSGSYSESQLDAAFDALARVIVEDDERVTALREIAARAEQIAIDAVGRIDIKGHECAHAGCPCLVAMAARVAVDRANTEAAFKEPSND